MAFVVVLGIGTIRAATEPQIVQTAETPKTQLYIRTVPAGAEIRLNGQSLGVSDGVFPAPAGVNRIVVELDGHVSQQHDVVVEPGRIKRLILELEKTPEFLLLRGPVPGSTGAEKTWADAEQLRQGEWHDVLTWADPTRDRVKGAWTRSGSAVVVTPADPETQHLRMMLPVVVEEGYDVEVEFTRTRGNDTVGLSLPVGSGHCILHLSAFAGRLAGLDMVGGVGIGTPGKSDDSRPSKLINDQRYRLLVRVRTTGQDATVEASLDGKPCVQWAGKQASLHVWEGWSLLQPHRLGLIVNESAVTFHSVRLRPIRGIAYRAKPVLVRRKGMPANQWVDLLPLADIERDRLGGRWVHEGEVFVVSPSGKPETNQCLMLPADVQGSYDIEVEFTRTSGNDSVIVNLPVGSRACTLQLSAWEGHVGGLEMIHGMAVGVPANPAVVRPNTLANGRRYRVAAKVRTQGTKVTIKVLLDDKPFVSWQGEQSALSLWGGWTMPHPSRPALGSNKNIVWFHSAKLRSISGKAELLTVAKDPRPEGGPDHDDPDPGGRHD